MGQYKFRTLTLKGNEKVRVDSVDHLCNVPGCFKYIDAGEPMVRWGSFDMHVSCAKKWCEERGIDTTYEF